MQTNPKLGGQRLLKTLNGTVYGPADTFTMCLWAADARITPGCFVSENGNDWQHAENCPEYRMQWAVDLPDGSTYGPLNLLALWELARDESVLPGTKIVNTVTGKTATLDESIYPLLMEEWRSLLASAGESVRGMWVRLQAELSTRAAEASRPLMEKMEELERKARASEQELADNLKLVAETQKFLAGRDDLVKTLQGRIQEAESRLLAAESEKKELAKKCAELSAIAERVDLNTGRELEAERANRTDLERKLQETVLSAAAAEERAARLSGELEDLRARSADAESAMEGAVARLERAAAEAAAGHERQLAVEREAKSLLEQEVSGLRTRLGAAEQSLAEERIGSQARLDAAESERLAAVERAAAAERQHAAKARELEEMSGRCEAAVQSAAAAARRLTEAEAAIEDAGLQMRAALEREAETQRRLSAGSEAAEREIRSLREGAADERRVHEQRLAEWTAQTGRLQSETAELQTQLNAARASIASAAESGIAKDNEIRELRAQLEKRGDLSEEEGKRLGDELAAAMRRVAELTGQFGQANAGLETARREAAETEQRLRDELAGVRRDLGTLMKIRTTVLKINEESRRTGGGAGINWLDSGPQPRSAVPAPAAAGFEGMPVADQVALLQEEIRAAVEYRERLRKENEILQRQSAEREAASRAREESLQGKIVRLDGEVASSAIMVRKTMEELEKREGLLRSIRKRAEDRERQLMARIAELEKRGVAAPTEGEWEHPSAEEAREAPRDPLPKSGGKHILSHVEAQLQTELRKWESLNQDDASKNGKEKKWFWRKSP